MLSSPSQSMVYLPGSSSGLHGGEALALEVVGGHVGHFVLQDRLPVLVVLIHAPYPEGGPAAVALQEGEPDARESLRDAAHDDGEAGVHLLNGVGGEVLGGPEVFVAAVETLSHGDWELAGGAFVEADGQIVGLTLGP